MNTVKFIKKTKAFLIRIKIHKAFGFLANLLIYTGYLFKMSKWIDKNKSGLRYNDFYNRKVLHKDREQLYAAFAADHQLSSQQVTYLEFGVGHGNSLRWWIDNNQHPDSGFWAFDTFEGLPEKYGNYDTGEFSLEGNFPDIRDKRINFVKGLFQQTLLKTLPDINFKNQLIIHIDSDLYSAALFTLGILYPYLKAGDYIIFDEFVVPGHEFKAFDDFTRSFYLDLEPIGAINNYLQMIFRVKEPAQTI